MRTPGCQEIKGPIQTLSFVLLSNEINIPCFIWLNRDHWEISEYKVPDQRA